jgi:hypothetical protein
MRRRLITSTNFFRHVCFLGWGFFFSLWRSWSGLILADLAGPARGARSVARLRRCFWFLLDFSRLALDSIGWQIGCSEMSVCLVRPWWWRSQSFLGTCIPQSPNSFANRLIWRFVVRLERP